MFETLIRIKFDKAITENKSNFQIGIPNIIIEQFKNIVSEYGFKYEFDGIKDSNISIFTIFIKDE